VLKFHVLALLQRTPLTRLSSAGLPMINIGTLSCVHTCSSVLILPGHHSSGRGHSSFAVYRVVESVVFPMFVHSYISLDIFGKRLSKNDLCRIIWGYLLTWLDVVRLSDCVTNSGVGGLSGRTVIPECTVS